ncbi:MAG: hypothetical protein JST75_19130 [Bacteroidetes bacterium]|nr:hypothetical protein [Bacteroidota bacterium]
MSKKIFLHGLIAGVLSAIVSVIYYRVHYFAFEVDFSKLVNVAGLLGINLLSCMIAATGYWLFKKWFKDKGEIIFNLSFSILSFASIVIPLAAKLPLDIQNPELFPGLTVPMHFFPALAWFTIAPLFKEKAK